MNIESTKMVLRGYHWPQSVLDATPPNGVFYLALNMTSACNYRCPYCFVGLANLKLSPDELSFNEKVRLIRQASDCEAKVLVMPGRGEPLGDSDFWKILEEANHLGLWVVVYTNGYFLNREKILRLKQADVSVYLKIDSFDRKVYEKMVGKKGVFARLRSNLDLLVEHFHKPIIENGRIISRLGINSVVSVQSAPSIPEIDAWCAERQIFYTCRSPVKVGEAELTWEYLVENRVENLRDIGRKYAERNFTSATELGQCGIYRFGITVENNGEVYVCPDAREGFQRIGNIREYSLQNLIRRKKERYPLNSSSGYCFVKSHKNLEEGEVGGK
ncbi:MAG: radical SAM protein [Planctomycetes bacterium]|uniref:radical SAM/SPASM domain-containing protein n=1 Tax=Candidatus Wunengus sp. YC65 TaxID=3367701 RepID=UPI001DA2AE79|nr:radical SAM protein [Planctomycetota bacterium]